MWNLKGLFRRFSKFALMGGACYLFGWEILTLLIHTLGVNEYIANGVQIALATGLNFLLNNFLTWSGGQNQVRTVKRGFRFTVVKAATFPVVEGLFAGMMFLSPLLKSWLLALGINLVFVQDYTLAHTLTTAVMAGLNYIVNDKFVFEACRRDPGN